jgi:hypothetical protein
MHSYFQNVRVEKGQNRFLRHRNFIFQRINIALVLANCYQIRTIISEPNKHEYYKIPLGFAIASICLQVLFTILMVISWQVDRNSLDKQGNIKKPESYRQGLAIHCHDFSSTYCHFKHCCCRIWGYDQQS